MKCAVRSCDGVAVGKLTFKGFALPPLRFCPSCIDAVRVMCEHAGRAMPPVESLDDGELS